MELQLMRPIGLALIALASLLFAGCEGEKAIDTTNRPKPGSTTTEPAAGGTSAPPMRGQAPAGQPSAGN